MEKQLRLFVLVSLVTVLVWALLLRIGWAANGSTLMEINFGQYAVPVILTVFLAIIYKIAGNPDGTSMIPDRAKPIIALCLGTALGIAGMYYQGAEPTFRTIVDYTLYGFMAGASAVGLWEGFRASIHPELTTAETKKIEKK